MMILSSCLSGPLPPPNTHVFCRTIQTVKQIKLLYIAYFRPEESKITFSNRLTLVLDKLTFNFLINNMISSTLSLPSPFLSAFSNVSRIQLQIKVYLLVR